MHIFLFSFLDDKHIGEPNILKTESKASEPAFKSSQIYGDACLFNFSFFLYIFNVYIFC